MNPCNASLRTLGALGFAAVGLLALAPARGDVVVRYQPCDPPTQGGTEICAQDPRYVAPATWFSDRFGSVSGGGFAGPTTLGAFLDNTRGGGLSVTANFWDDYTLVGPGSDPITFQSLLHVDGTWEHTDRFSTSSVAFGFLIGTGTYWPAPASLLVSFSGLGGEPVDLFAHRELTLAPGDTIRLGFQLQISGSNSGGGSVHTRLDFMNTAELGFPDLPPGYYIRSTQGFNGVGGPPATNGVPLPATLPLALLGLAALGAAATRHRHATA